jgi:integrase/recombinase XerD
MSALRESAEEYLQLRRALGFKLYAAGLLLDQFVCFAEQKGASVITRALALEWATQPKTCRPAQWARRLGVVGKFARYRSASDPRTEVPTPDLLPFRYRRKTPYIYREEQIVQLLQAAKRLPSATGLRALTYCTLFGLLAVTGMRVGEVVCLNREDVDLQNGVISIRNAKYGRSRLIPVHSSTQRALEVYAKRRDQIRPASLASQFFLSEDDTGLTVNIIEWTFRKLSHQIGLRGPCDRDGPRIHDLRHTFVVRTMQSWYRANVDVERHLLHLTTYLGHGHVNDTYWYLTGTPELLQWAVKHIDSTKGGCSS